MLFLVYSAKAWVSGLSLKKTHMCGCHMPKRCFIAIACNYKLHAIIWPVISIKLSIGKKITGLDIMTLNRCLRGSYTVYIMDF